MLRRHFILACACGLFFSWSPYGVATAETQREPFPIPNMTPQRSDVEPLEYVPARIAYYPPGGDRRGDGQWNRMQLPLSPEESMKHCVVPEGFELELFAAESDIGKAICMSWDEQGRLWIAETIDYPNEKQPDGKGRDRIRICEDKDGDGRADTFTVFADKLSIPTSLAFSYDGVIVHQAPDTLFLQDTDGDDRADVRKILFTGWSTADTHAGPSNLNYGPDNWFYGTVGYAGFAGEIAGQQRSFRQGFYRFKVQRLAGEVEVTDFEFLRNTNNNTWGLGFSEEGILFGSTANRNPSEYMPIANRYYERVRGWSSIVLSGIADTHLFQAITENVRQVDHHGGYTAAAGHALYTARRYPKEYWNRAAFVAGPTGHLVGTFVLSRVGSQFRSTNRFNLLASDDEWAAPIMAEVGPDGNVWVIDWYNYIVQHNPTPVGFQRGKGNAYVTDLRDKKHGRIYRVTYGGNNGGAFAGAHSPGQASSPDWVSALAHPNMFWRRHAQRLLVERGDPAILPRLQELTGRQRVDEVGIDVGAMHALRTIQGLSEQTPQVDRQRQALAIGALRHPSAGVVRTAVEVLPRNRAGLNALLDAELLNHSDAQVRLVTLLALSDMPASSRAAAAVLAVLQDPAQASDRWIPDAATSAAATNASQFLVLAMKRDRCSPNTIAAASIVAEHLARQAHQDAMIRVVRSLGTASPGAADAVVRGIGQGWSSGDSLDLDDKSDASLVAAFERLSPGPKGQLIRLASSWGSKRLAGMEEKIAATLLQTVRDTSAADDVRIDAAVQLIGLRNDDNQVVIDVLGTISPQTAPNVAGGIFSALTGSRARDLGKTILSGRNRLTPAAQGAALRVLLARPETTVTLLEAIGQGKVPQDDLSLDQQQTLLTHPVREVRQLARATLSATGGIPNPDRQQVLASLMALTSQQGDTTRGQAVFKKECAACHTHRGEGEKVGPDLTGMAVHPKPELLTHIIDPSRSVEFNYRSYSVVTVDGLVRSGMLASETRTAIELVDAQGKRAVVLREDIEELIASSKSVMPDGFEKKIDEQGLTDLLEFLTAKGKYLPLPLQSVATAISTKGLFHTGDDGPDRLIFDDWSPKQSGGIPFHLVDPQGTKKANIILLNGPRGSLPPSMPKSVSLTCNTAAKGIHLLSGISGWGYPATKKESASMTVRLNYVDGKSELHPLKNGVHFADYIRRVDVPQSAFAFQLRNQQVRRLSVHPKREVAIGTIEFIKGNDPTAPMIVAVTVETLADAETASGGQSDKKERKK